MREWEKGEGNIGGRGSGLVLEAEGEKSILVV